LYNVNCLNLYQRKNNIKEKEKKIMKSENRTIQRGFIAVAGLMLMCALFLSLSVGTFAASKAAKNKTARTKLTAKLNSTLPSYSKIRYKFADVTADGIDELIMVCAPSKKGGKNSDYLIYTYKNKKVKKIYDYSNYAVVHFRFHKKTKSIITYTLGDNKEGFFIYQIQKNGKYKLLGSKSRVARKAGAIEDGIWTYKKGTKKTSTALFNKIVKKTKKGTPKVYNVREFTILTYQKPENTETPAPTENTDPTGNSESAGDTAATN
jgi:hypothetical protein